MEVNPHSVYLNQAGGKITTWRRQVGVLVLDHHFFILSIIGLRLVGVHTYLRDLNYSVWSQGMDKTRAVFGNFNCESCSAFALCCWGPSI